MIRYNAIMKSLANNHKKTYDDSLYGLLLSYKSNNTYIKVLVSEKGGSIAVLLTDNPRRWNPIIFERYKEYKELRRLEIKAEKLSLKYLNPYHIVSILGASLGIKVPVDKIFIINKIDNDGYYIFETSLKYKQRVLISIRRILNLSPQKKYEILEKCLAINKD